MAVKDLEKQLDAKFEKKIKPLNEVVGRPKNKPVDKALPKKEDEVLGVKISNKKPKPFKKEEKKIIEQTKDLAPKPSPVKREIVKTPEIEDILHQTTKFDLNWYLMKKKWILFIKWVFSPYTREYWEKRGFKKKEKVIKKEYSSKPLFTETDLNKPLTEKEIRELIRIKQAIGELHREDKNIFRSEK